jgi:rubrerythrin
LLGLFVLIKEVIFGKSCKGCGKTCKGLAFKCPHCGHDHTIDKYLE